MSAWLLLGFLTIVAADAAKEQRTLVPVAAQKHRVVVPPPTHDPSQPRTAGLRLSVPHDTHPSAQVFPVPQAGPSQSAALEGLGAARAKHLPTRTVCGMVLFPTDPTIDPGMVHVPERHSTVEFKIRRIQPTICVEPHR
jgi:hypothetical protein